MCDVKLSVKDYEFNRKKWSEFAAKLAHGLCILSSGEWEVLDAVMNENELERKDVADILEFLENSSFIVRR